MSSGQRTLIAAVLGMLSAVGVLTAWSALEHRASTRDISNQNEPGERSRVATGVHTLPLPPAPPAVMAAPERTNPVELAAAVSPLDSPPEVEETAEELAFRLAQRFEADKPADATGRAFAGVVESAFVDQSKRGVSVKHAECRDRICKARVRFDDAAQEASVLEEVLVYGRLRPYAVAVPERSEQQGATELTLYLARSGELPGD